MALKCGVTGQAPERQFCIDYSRTAEGNDICTDLRCLSKNRICPDCIVQHSQEEILIFLRMGESIFVNRSGKCVQHKQYGARSNRMQRPDGFKEKYEQALLEYMMEQEAAQLASMPAVEDDAIADCQSEIVPDSNAEVASEAGEAEEVYIGALEVVSDETEEVYIGALEVVSEAFVAPADVETSANRIKPTERMQGIVSSRPRPQNAKEYKTCAREVLSRNGALEIMYTIRRWKNEFHLPDAIIAKHFDKTDPWPAQRMSLLKLDEEILVRLDPEIPRNQQPVYSILMFLARVKSKTAQKKFFAEIEQRPDLHSDNVLAWLKDQGALNLPADAEPSVVPAQEKKNEDNFVRLTLRQYGELDSEGLAAALDTSDKRQTILEEAMAQIAKLQGLVLRIKRIE